jgi:hypothetical protein
MMTEEITRIQKPIKAFWEPSFNDFHGSSSGLYVYSERIGYPVLQNREIATILKLEQYHIRLFGFHWIKMDGYPRNYEKVILDKISEIGLYIVNDSESFMMSCVALCLGLPDKGEFQGTWNYGDIFRPIEMIPYLLHINGIEKCPGWNYESIEIQVVDKPY